MTWGGSTLEGWVGFTISELGSASPLTVFRADPSRWDHAIAGSALLAISNLRKWGEKLPERKYTAAWVIASALAGAGFAWGVRTVRSNGQTLTVPVERSPDNTLPESSKPDTAIEAGSSSGSSSDSVLPEGRYDIRQGAAGYALTIGTLGALAVPALFVLFAVPQASAPQRAPLVALAGGLLIVAILASTGGAIGLAAIGAEQDLTGNLVPAAMFLGVAASVAIIAILGAFEVLAAVYLPESTTLFAVIVSISGIMGAFFVALSIADSWHTGPRDPARKKEWQKTQWIRTQKKGDWQTGIVAALGIVTASAGIWLRMAGVHVSPSTRTVDLLIVGSLFLVMGAIVFAGIRTMHRADGTQKGLRAWEAYGTTLVISAYALILVIMLPTAQSASAKPAAPRAHPASPTSASVTPPPERSTQTANASAAVGIRLLSPDHERGI